MLFNVFSVRYSLFFLQFVIDETNGKDKLSVTLLIRLDRWVWLTFCIQLLIHCDVIGCKPHIGNFSENYVTSLEI